MFPQCLILFIIYKTLNSKSCNTLLKSVICNLIIHISINHDISIYKSLWIISQEALLNIKKVKCIKYTENKKILKIKKTKKCRLNLIY